MFRNVCVGRCLVRATRLFSQCLVDATRYNKVRSDEALFVPPELLQLM